MTPAAETGQGEYLRGGSGGVWRVPNPGGGFSVHRPVGAWTPAVHALLAHLEARGLDGVPRVLGFDDEGREVLSYLPGVSPDPEVAPADRVLAEAAAWLRRFHDAVADFRPADIEWRQGERGLAPGEVVCHNDPGVYNWVVDPGQAGAEGFAGMIDWDRAGPGRPLDDLAFMCWTALPLVREADGGAAESARRLRLVAEAYGGVEPAELLDAVGERMRLTVRRWETGLALGDPGTIALRDAGIMARHAGNLRGFDARKTGIAAALRR